MRLRVIEIPARGFVTHPSNTDLHSGVDASLQHAEQILSVGNFEIRKLAAPSPHTLGRHDVLWLNDLSHDKPLHWDSTSEQNSITATDFWNALETHVRSEQARSENPSLRAYMYSGFTLPEWKNGTTAPVIWRGLQSQIRLHMHLNEALPDEVVDDWIEANSPKNISMIARFLNLAGEHMGEMFPHAISSFGERFSFTQNIMQSENFVTPYQRNLHAFPNLATAIQASHELKSKISQHWFLMARTLADHSPTVFSGQIFNTLQSAVPNFVFIIPSEKDRENTSRAEETQEVWVAPFSVVGAPEILTPGGVHLKRLPALESR